MGIKKEGNIAVAQILRFFNNNLELVVFQKKLNQINHKNWMVFSRLLDQNEFFNFILTYISAKTLPKIKIELNRIQSTFYIEYKI